MKSKMPCEPGPAPLMKLAQATGLCGGMLVPRSLKPPAARSLVRLGSRPAFIMLSESRGSIPSMPITITFLPRLLETRPLLPSQNEPAPTAAAPAAAIAERFRKTLRLNPFFDVPAIHSPLSASRAEPGNEKLNRPQPVLCRPCSREPSPQTYPEPWGRYPGAVGL